MTGFPLAARHSWLVHVALGPPPPLRVQCPPRDRPAAGQLLPELSRREGLTPASCLTRVPARAVARAPRAVCVSPELRGRGGGRGGGGPRPWRVCLLLLPGEPALCFLFCYTWAYVLRPFLPLCIFLICENSFILPSGGCVLNTWKYLFPRFDSFRSRRGHFDASAPSPRSRPCV